MSNFYIKIINSSDKGDLLNRTVEIYFLIFDFFPAIFQRYHGDLFLEAPVFMTCTVIKLWQLINYFFPEKLLPHAFKATTTVSISHKLICRFSLNMKSGNEQWKYLRFIQPPEPFKLESTENTWSALDHSYDSINDTPL